MPKRVLIIGAGQGGLASAMLLAKAGLAVTVIERLPHVGGRTSTARVQGFRFDLGPTFFLYPQVLEDIFTAAGYDLRSEVTLVRLDPQYRLVFGAGGELLATSDARQMEEAIAALSPHDSAGFRRFLVDSRAKFAGFLPWLQAPFLGWRDVLTPRLLRLLPTLRLVAVRRFRQPLIGVLLHPVSVLALLVMQWYALVRAVLARPVTWKGRDYTPP